MMLCVYMSESVSVCVYVCELGRMGESECFIEHGRGSVCACVRTGVLHNTLWTDISQYSN